VIIGRVLDAWLQGSAVMVRANIKTETGPVVMSTFALADAATKSFDEAKSMLFGAIKDRFGGECAALTGFQAMVADREKIEIETPASVAAG